MIRKFQEQGSFLPFLLIKSNTLSDLPGKGDSDEINSISVN